MPELPEVEAYRGLAEGALGREVAEVVAPDAWFLKRGLTAAAAQAALLGRVFAATRRIGKLLLLDTGGQGSTAARAGGHGPVLGLRFGMSGRLLVDGRAGVDRLVYSSDKELEGWDRFAIRFADGGDLRIGDARRLGGVELDPDETRLGPDALALTRKELREALGTSTAPLKARIMDQSRVAGVGNLAADEALWRAGLDPARPAGSLSPVELRRLHRHLTSTLALLIERGGSHTGDLMAERRPDGVCPKHGVPLMRRTVGGRTSYSCPRHQV